MGKWSWSFLSDRFRADVKVPHGLEFSTYVKLPIMVARKSAQLLTEADDTGSMDEKILWERQANYLDGLESSTALGVRTMLVEADGLVLELAAGEFSFVLLYEAEE